MSHPLQPPTVILSISYKKGKRIFKLHVKEQRGRGKMAEVYVERQPSKAQAIDVLLERAHNWKEHDRKIIKDKAYRLMWDSPWPLTDEWLISNTGERRL